MRSGFFGQSAQQRASGQRHVRSRNFRQNILRLVILPELPQGSQETVQLEARFLRHLPPRKRSPDPAAAGFFRCFRGLCEMG